MKKLQKIICGNLVTIYGKDDNDIAIISPPNLKTFNLKISTIYDEMDNNSLYNGICDWINNLRFKDDVEFYFKNSERVNNVKLNIQQKCIELCGIFEDLGYWEDYYLRTGYNSRMMNQESFIIENYRDSVGLEIPLPWLWLDNSELIPEIHEYFDKGEIIIREADFKQHEYTYEVTIKVFRKNGQEYFKEFLHDYDFDTGYGTVSWCDIHEEYSEEIVV